MQLKSEMPLKVKVHNLTTNVPNTIMATDGSVPNLRRGIYGRNFVSYFLYIFGTYMTRVHFKLHDIQLYLHTNMT